MQRMLFPRSVWHCQQFFSLKSIRAEGFRVSTWNPCVKSLLSSPSSFWLWVLGSSMAYEKRERWANFALMSSVQISPFQLKLMGDLCSSLKLLIKLTWCTFHFPLIPQLPLKRAMTLWFMAQATFSCRGKLSCGFQRYHWISPLISSGEKRKNLAWEDSSRFAVKESTGWLFVGF